MLIRFQKFALTDIASISSILDDIVDNSSVEIFSLSLYLSIHRKEAALIYE